MEQPPARTGLAWALWSATIGCCAAGLEVALLVARPLTTGLLASGAGCGRGDGRGRPGHVRRRGPC